MAAKFFACEGYKRKSSKKVDCVAEKTKKYTKALENYTKKYESIIKKNPNNATGSFQTSKRN